MNPTLAQTLAVPTSRAWFDTATERWQELLVDHANCEKKAASTALSLLFAYADDVTLCSELSRLAREELRHFEQVQRMMVQLGVPFMRLQPSRYADGLRKAMHRDDPKRLIDILVCGALIEARSCERFEGLVPRLQTPLADFYADLARSEARHHLLYLRLATERSSQSVVGEALRRLSAVEAELVQASDSQFRFHSGTPAAA